jgi:hypothetical protein
VYQTSYSASEFSGAEWIKVTAGSLVDSVLLKMHVADLELLGAGTGYTLGGADDWHPSNHYGTHGANRKLDTLGSKYDSAYSGSRLYYNDQSLQFGGWFDIHHLWTGAHSAHRVGINIDIQRTGDVGVPANRQSFFQTILTNMGIAWQIDDTDPLLHDSTHYHLGLGG